MNLHFIHRRRRQSHRRILVFQRGRLAVFLGAAVVGASMFGVVRTIDHVVWGQAYKQRVVDGTLQANPDAQTLAGYASSSPGVQFRPVSDRIFGH